MQSGRGGLLYVQADKASRNLIGQFQGDSFKLKKQTQEIEEVKERSGPGIAVLWWDECAVVKWIIVNRHCSVVLPTSWGAAKHLALLPQHGTGSVLLDMATGKAAAEASQIIGTHACSSCITHPLIIGYRYRFEINLNQVIHMIICNIAIVYTFLGF